MRAKLFNIGSSKSPKVVSHNRDVNNSLKRSEEEETGNTIGDVE
jgi:hypothetical protein